MNTATQKSKKFDWIALLGTVSLIVAARETGVWLTSLIHHPELGNLTGLFLLLFVLVLWRSVAILPLRMIEMNGRLMKDSAFAFLPVGAGSVVLLANVGHELWAIMLVIAVSTLLPMWVFAILSKKYL